MKRNFLLALALISPCLSWAVDMGAIEQAAANLEQFRALQDNAGIQSPEVSFAMRKAITIADLIVAPDGTLDIEACAALQPYFIPEQPTEYDVNMRVLLNQLDDSWQPILAAVTKPLSQSGPSALIVKALLGLRSSDQLTDRQAKVALLSALLAPYSLPTCEQCFVTGRPGGSNGQYYRNAAQDYTNLIKYGFITREFNQRTTNYFFLPKLADPTLYHPFSIDKHGVIVGSNLYLLDAPCFAAAARLMGADAIPDLFTRVIRELFQGYFAADIEITPLLVIETIAQIEATLIPGTDPTALSALGRYAFSSQTDNPVFKSAEAALASVAEDMTPGAIRTQINACIQRVLRPVMSLFPSLVGGPGFLRAFPINLDNAYCLIYDPSLTFNTSTGVINGGFVTYRRNLTDGTQLGSQIVTPRDFGQMVADTIDLTRASHPIFIPFSPYALSVNEFLLPSLRAFDPANAWITDINTYTQLVRTPMKSYNSSNVCLFGHLDLNAVPPEHMHLYTPLVPKDLFKWTMILSRTAPHQLLHMDSPQRVVEFVPGHPDMVASVRSKKSSYSYLHDTLYVPGVPIATRLIDPQLRTALNEAMWNLIASYGPDRVAYNKLLARLAATPLVIQKHCRRLYEGVRAMLRLDGVYPESTQLAVAFDNVILSLISPADLAVLQQTAIRFAQTDATVEGKKVYLCAYFNLRTQEAAIGRIDEDRKNLVAMSEFSWVNNLLWNVNFAP